MLTNSITRIAPTLLAFFSDYNAAEIRPKNNFFLSAAITDTYQQAQRLAVGRLLALAFEPYTGLNGTLDQWTLVQWPKVQ